MCDKQTHVTFRVRYCETDQMGTFSSARALEWFELGRTEHLRRIGALLSTGERKSARSIMDEEEDDDNAEEEGDEKENGDEEKAKEDLQACANELKRE